MTKDYLRQHVLAMELNHPHIGRLVQVLSDEWSVTGYLEAVAQHDNRTFDIEYPSYRLIPSGGEIYTVLTIGPWRAEVIGNQPVTVEYVGAEITQVDPVRQPEIAPGPDVIPGQLELGDPGPA